MNSYTVMSLKVPPWGKRFWCVLATGVAGRWRMPKSEPVNAFRPRMPTDSLFYGPCFLTLPWR